MFYHNAGSETKNTDDSIICSTLIQVMIRKQDFVSRRNVIFSVFTLFLRRFHYVCFTTCFRLENIVYHQNFHAINFLLFIISIALLIINNTKNHHMGQIDFHTDATEELCNFVLQNSPPRLIIAYIRRILDTSKHIIAVPPIK